MEKTSSKNSDSQFEKLLSSFKMPLKAALILFVVFVIAGAVTLYVESRKTETPLATTIKTKKFNDVVRLSTMGDDVKPLQDYLVTKLKDGKNDDDTKSAIYWITHRYFDNGGNFYEIYDFVQAHKELSFINGAEAIYPEAFKKIKSHEAGNFSIESLQALLGYYDMIDAKGYAGVTLWGLAANKYSELALSTQNARVRGVSKLSKSDSVLFQAEMSDRAMHYIKKIDDSIAAATVKDKDLKNLLGKETRDEDVLVGLNQYSSAIQNMKGVGFKSSHPFTALEIYEFNSELARTKVGRLYFFTSYLYATSLISGKEATKESVKEPLERLVAYVRADPSVVKAPHSSVERVLNTRITKETSVYSLENAQKLASLNQTFKDWLLENGWNAADLK